MQELQNQLVQQASLIDKNHMANALSREKKGLIKILLLYYSLKKIKLLPIL